MGMAASQARYLGLTARKTNVEYEGQQVNQQRTALANESAGLFNQLLTMNVPTPPSTQDYTKLQYSFSDGMNTDTITNYTPLATTDPDYGDYNYNVTYTHKTSTFTGIKQQNADPKIVGVRTTAYTGTPAVTPTTTAYANYLAGTNPINTYNYTKVGNQALTAFDPTNTTQAGEVQQIVKDNPASQFATDYAAGTGNISYYTMGTGTSATRQYVCQSDLTASVDTNIGSSKSTIPTCWTPIVGGTTTGTGAAGDYTLGAFDATNLYATATLGGVTSYTSSRGNVFATAADATSDSQGAATVNPAIDAFTRVDVPIDQSDTSTSGVVQTTENNYYAAYIDKDTSKTEKAFLDTDTTTSRFNSITLQSTPDATFSVNAETKTDDAGYQDAMNQYNYNTALYQQKVQDINAQTSVIQQQDRTLELRLRQLDTEQEALQTEMESVKKVIDKNIESTFKTFQ